MLIHIKLKYNMRTCRLMMRGPLAGGSGPGRQAHDGHLAVLVEGRGPGASRSPFLCLFVKLHIHYIIFTFFITLAFSFFIPLSSSPYHASSKVQEVPSIGARAAKPAAGARAANSQNLSKPFSMFACLKQSVVVCLCVCLLCLLVTAHANYLLFLCVCCSKPQSMVHMYK